MKPKTICKIVDRVGTDVRVMLEQSRFTWSIGSTAVGAERRAWARTEATAIASQTPGEFS